MPPRLVRTDRTDERIEVRHIAKHVGFESVDLEQRAHQDFGTDSALRRHGERIVAAGGKAAKKRAVIAVARKLSVVLHRLWTTGEQYEPFPHSTTKKKAS